MSASPPSGPPRGPGTRTTAPSLNKTVPDTEGITAAPVEPHSACLVVIKGDNVGQKYDLEGELTIGRDPNAGIPLDDGLVSRTHAKLVPDNIGVRVFDMCSTNGTFVDDKQINTVYLKDGNQLAIGKTIFKFISRNNIEAAYHEHIYSLTRFDALTGIHNRPTFDGTITSAIAKSARTGEPLALMLFDIDHFKRCNDTYGHRAGDYVLKQVGLLLGDHVRDGDFAARYGGEEFAVIVRRLPPPGPARFADHLRGLIQAQRFEFEGQHIPVTISAGVASWEPNMRSPAELIELADQRLYRAKQSGRNQIIAH
ncbi:MAG: GGDEF domain-containing protein [Myxococcales bacterium]|nr:GGDEF domain-containing protein [Myxococcales bacterium]